jgi:hypothetical protein
MALCGAHVADGAVTVVMVIPVHELTDPTASGIEVGKTLARELRSIFGVTLVATTEDLATWPSVAKQVADTPACVESRIVKVRALLLFAYWKR